jgi:hypothetical protein
MWSRLLSTLLYLHSPACDWSSALDIARMDRVNHYHRVLSRLYACNTSTRYRTPQILDVEGETSDGMTRFDGSGLWGLCPAYYMWRYVGYRPALTGLCIGSTRPWRWRHFLLVNSDREPESISIVYFSKRFWTAIALLFFSFHDGIRILLHRQTHAKKTFQVPRF